MILLVKKWFWHNKVGLEIDDDGICTNEYLYRNTGFSWITPATIISAFHNDQINYINTYKEKERILILSQVASTQTITSIY